MVRREIGETGGARFNMLMGTLQLVAEIGGRFGRFGLDDQDGHALAHEVALAAPYGGLHCRHRLAIELANRDLADPALPAEKMIAQRLVRDPFHTLAPPTLAGSDLSRASHLAASPGNSCHNSRNSLICTPIKPREDNNNGLA